MSRDAFSTIRAAMSMPERHPEALPSVCQVALVMATFATGQTGADIRPGLSRLVELTHLDRGTVRRAIKWLEKHGEIRRVKDGRSARGNVKAQAAEFAWIGGMDGDTAAPAPAKAPAAKAPEPDRHVCREWDGFGNCTTCGAYEYDVTARAY